MLGFTNPAYSTYMTWLFLLFVVWVLFYANFNRLDWSGLKMLNIFSFSQFFFFFCFFSFRQRVARYTFLIAPRLQYLQKLQETYCTVIGKDIRTLYLNKMVSIIFFFFF